MNKSAAKTKNDSSTAGAVPFASKHAAGPWEVVPNEPHLGYGPFDASNYLIRTADNYYVAAVMSDVPGMGKEVAVLIAAAPAMLRELKNMTLLFKAALLCTSVEIAREAKPHIEAAEAAITSATKG